MLFLDVISPEEVLEDTLLEWVPSRYALSIITQLMSNDLVYQNGTEKNIFHPILDNTGTEEELTVGT